MRLTVTRLLALLLPLALLAGCHKSAQNDQRSASGEVLQGTVSDAMLPLDKLKSEPPLLAPSNAGTTPEGVKDKQSGAAGAADVTTSESSAEPAEAATAAPTPAPSATSTP